MHGEGNVHGKGGMHGKGGACVVKGKTGETATAAVGTHPTGMHSCLQSDLFQIYRRISLLPPLLPLLVFWCQCFLLSRIKMM